MTFKERLAGIDPATLEAGAELDALVAEILGWELVTHVQSIEDSSASARAVWRTGGTASNPIISYFTPSTSPGLAFEVLWDWLDEHVPIVLSNEELNVLISVAPDNRFNQYFEKVLPIHFCRAVVAVAKARSR